jgi:hypothetical protein
MGVVEVGGDMQSMGLRDRFIGWSIARKFAGGLNSLGNLGTCVATAPFGLLTGGKFAALASATDLVANLWFERYAEPLAMVCVTSLYGRSSQYNRLPGFSYLGDTPGHGTAHVSKADTALLNRFMAANNLLPRTGGTALDIASKQDLLARACATLKIDRASIATHQPRGVYVCPLGDDALPFLRGERPTFAPTTETVDRVADYWMNRWYAMRWPKVRDEIARFDHDTYRVDSQIELCRAAS